MKILSYMLRVRCMAFAAAAMLCNGLLFAADQQPTPQSPTGGADYCSQDLIISNFPAPFVAQTLQKFKVPQDKWDSIQHALVDADSQVVPAVEKKASAMNPNPLDDPQQRRTVARLFRETTQQIFSDTLKAQGITDDKQIQSMLDDIQQQKAQRFAECMKQNALPPPPGMPAGHPMMGPGGSNPQIMGPGGPQPQPSGSSSTSGPNTSNNQPY